MKKRHRQTPTMHNYPLYLTLVLLALTTLACRRSTPPAATKPTGAPPPLISVATPIERDLTLNATYTGSVEPIRVACLASPAEGPLVVCNVSEGDYVATRDLVAPVGRSRTAEAALSAAREELQRRQADFTRVERLVASGALPGESLDSARSGLKQAEAQMAAMETGHDDYAITAQSSGIVSKVWTSTGDYVAPRTPLVELFDPDTLVVRFSLPERTLPAVTTGMVVTVTLDAYPDRTFNATISRLFPTLDPATRTATAEATLTEEVRLWRGLFARITLPIRSVTATPILPHEALLILPDKSEVVYVVKEQQVELRPVTIALDNGTHLAVAEGVKAGESVVVRGHETLRSGLTVRLAGQPATPSARPQE